MPSTGSPATTRSPCSASAAATNVRKNRGRTTRRRSAFGSKLTVPGSSWKAAARTRAQASLSSWLAFLTSTMLVLLIGIATLVGESASWAIEGSGDTLIERHRGRRCPSVVQNRRRQGGRNHRQGSLVLFPLVRGPLAARAGKERLRDREQDCGTLVLSLR